MARSRNVLPGDDRPCEAVPAALVGRNRGRNASIFALLAPERRVRAFVARAEQHHMRSVADGLGLLAPLPVPLPDTRRVIGITRGTDSLGSPGAQIVVEETARRCPEVLTALDDSALEPAPLGGE